MSTAPRSSGVCKSVDVSSASGVAVSMELARIMATRRPAATIVFTVVAGEEQNLYVGLLWPNNLNSDFGLSLKTWSESLS